MRASQARSNKNGARFFLGDDLALSVMNVAPSSFSTGTPVPDIRLRKLLRLMETEPLSTIQDLALAFNLSESHLHHVFKKATGMRLGRALTEKKLQRAAQLLAATNMSIKEIAGTVGYQHTSSFIRAFERRFDQSPRYYRLGNVA